MALTTVFEKNMRKYGLGKTTKRIASPRAMGSIGGRGKREKDRMLLLGRILFVGGFIGLAIQILDIWLEIFGLPIDKSHLPFALAWWACFGGAAALGTWLMKKHGD